MTQTTHPFEKSGLGKAPFYVVGLTVEVYQPYPDAPQQPGGSCDYCGNGIKYVYAIQSADDRTFGVGSECVKKADPELYEEYRQRQREERELVKGLEEMELHALLADDTVKDELAQHPHPQDWRAAKGETLLDSVLWMQENAGHSGKLRTLRQVKDVTGASLTDEEVAAYAPVHEALVAAACKAREDEAKREKRNRKARILRNNKKFAFVIEALEDANPSPFIDSVLSDWRNLDGNPWGTFTGRALDICCNIAAKREGRRNSKAYNAAKDHFWNLVGDEPEDD